MDNLQIYITIEKPMTDRNLRITGDIELLRAFLSGMGSFEMQSFPAVDPSPTIGAPRPTAKRNKRKKITKVTLSALTATAN